MTNLRESIEEIIPPGKVLGVDDVVIDQILKAVKKTVPKEKEMPSNIPDRNELAIGYNQCREDFLKTIGE